MRLKLANKIYFCHFLCLFILLVSLGAALGEEKYVPEPIVFVHGLNSNESTWNNAKDELEKYFINGQTGEPKYGYRNADKKPHYPSCNYESINTGDIPTIARKILDDAISHGIDNLPQECTHRKVNVVAHSMGGVVTRSLLKQRSASQNSINKVIFIGTPHHGSPYASAVWLLNKVKNEKFTSAVKQHLNYFSKPFYSVVSRFAPSVQSAYFSLVPHAAVRHYSIYFLLSKVKQYGIDPNSVAIDQLRLNENTSYNSIIYGIGIGNNISISASYDGSDVFLSSQRNNLSTPPNYQTIKGRNASNIDFWALAELVNFNNAFTFPEGESLEEVSMNGGDGMASLASQEGGLGNVYRTLEGVHHLQETSQAQAILEALDDPPEIERVYAVPCDWSVAMTNYYYVIIKAKEYLLADLEIESMDLNGEPVDLNEFSANPPEGPYKPYYKFGKKFLEERNDDNNIRDRYGNNITLEPGEFYVRCHFPNQIRGSIPINTYDLTYALNIKLRNPAGKTTENQILIGRPKAYGFFTPPCIDVPPYRVGDLTMPTTTIMKYLRLESGSSPSMHVEVGVCNYDSYHPFTIIRQANIPLQYSEGFYETFLSSTFATWSGSDGGGGTVPQNGKYKIKITVSPSDIYARPIYGDCKLDMPIYVWRGVISADPTFIQTHRSYSQLAKFLKLIRFRKYGYNLENRILDGERESSAICQKIDETITKILKFEDNFGVEKQRLIFKMKAESSNVLSIIRALKENRASKGLIAKLENENRQLTTQKIEKAVERLKKDKETQVSSIIKTANNSVSAFTKSPSFDNLITNLPCQ